ncbi:MAG TPA: ATP-binding protein, partial [Thermoanaerobaculia bacterium]|nr:ATP-binding protein [Thermoanaerobaculia bacterium]
SVKFTPEGGSVGLTLEVAGAFAEVRVRDSGIGIDPSMLPHLFEPFSQADVTLDRSMGGLGLGLSLAKGLIDLHGGTVEAKSAGKDTGTEIVVRLPLSAAPPAARDRVPDLPPRPRRILVVEDNVDGADSLRALLELEGHTVDVAHDGPRAIEKARELRPEVIVCDIGLPVMDGYAVARMLKGDPALRGAFLIALTGYALPDDQQRAADAGFDAHVSKPLTSLEQLRRVIGSAP